MSAASTLTRKHKLLLWLFVLFLLVPGAFGFIEKFVMLCRVLFSTPEGGYAIIPIINYLLMACGLLCLFAWAVTHGMFRDIERPKYDLLQREKALDHEEGIEWE